jgi:hypothetical protein
LARRATSEQIWIPSSAARRRHKKRTTEIGLKFFGGGFSLPGIAARDVTI